MNGTHLSVCVFICGIQFKDLKPFLDSNIFMPCNCNHETEPQIGYEYVQMPHNTHTHTHQHVHTAKTAKIYLRTIKRTNNNNLHTFLNNFLEHCHDCEIYWHQFTNLHIIEDTCADWFRFTHSHNHKSGN